MLALDIATDFTFSHPIQDSAECDQDLTGYLGGMMQGLPVMQTLVAFPKLIPLSTSSGASKLVNSTKNNSTGLGRMFGFARDRTRERYGANKIVRRDILGSMVQRGLSFSEAEAEGLFAA
ncbi:MAG: hypothetical protein Q9195_006457 [Heterodermia aff. obscurata]